jgi:hypothetical protein
VTICLAKDEPTYANFAHQGIAPFSKGQKYLYSQAVTKNRSAYIIFKIKRKEERKKKKTMK